MKKLITIITALAILTSGSATAFASAFEGTTDYYFESNHQNEFYGDERLNEGLAEQVSSEIVNSQFSIVNSKDYPDTWAGLVLNDNPSYTVMPVEELRNADGSIGRLQIPAIGLNVKVYDGDELAAMKKGVGHIEGTSVWGSNVGLIGHNRGVNEYFGKLKTLSIGDLITYSTNAGTRTFRVTFAGQIDHTDWSMLQYTTDNRLTLITCVENVLEKRVCIQAAEWL